MIGVLALQGDFAEHLNVLRSMHTACREVRGVRDLHGCTHLILPGGESTAQCTLLRTSGLDSVICQRVRDGALAVYGTCAGAILLAVEITGKNAPKPLGMLDITVERNAYGNQLQSFSAQLQGTGIGSIAASFIRAPKITRVGDGVIVLASHEGTPVLVRKERILAGTFHPEVRGETAVHRLFLAL